MPLDRRLQILLDRERHARLVAAARERGVSVAAVVREAIDREVPGPERDRRAAAARILTASEMDTPGPAELRRELDRAHGRHE